MVSPAEVGRVYWDLNALKEVKSSREAVKEFEAYLINIFLKEADFKVSGSLFGNDFQSSIYKELFRMELSEKIAQKDPLNLIPLFERALKSYGGATKL